MAGFYPIPPVIEPKLLVQFGDEHKAKDIDTDWRGGSGAIPDVFLEGITSTPDGALYVVDVPFGRILRVDPDRKITECVQWDGEPNGLAVRVRELLGHFCTVANPHTDSGRTGRRQDDCGRLQEGPAPFRPEGELDQAVPREARPSLPAPRQNSVQCCGTDVSRLGRRNLESWKGLNDLVISSSGDICEGPSFACSAGSALIGVSFVALDFTDQGQTGLQDQTGGVWCYTAAGRLHQLISNGISPNGIVLSPDEKSLYVAMYVFSLLVTPRKVDTS